MAKFDLRVLAVIGMFVLAVLFMSGGLKSFFGFTTLALSSVNFQSSDPILSGNVFVLTTSVGGLGQYATGATGSYSASQIKASDGTQAANDLMVSITSSQQKCEYPIAVDYASPKIYKMYSKEYPIDWSHLLGWSDSDIYADCSKYGDVISYGFKPASSFSKGCVYGISQGVVGKLPERPNILTKVDMSVSAKGQTYSGTISNKEATTVKFGDVAYATWSGGLKTYDECPQALQSNIMAKYNNGWSLIDSTKYDNYKTDYNIIYDKLVSSTWILGTFTDLNNRLSTTNYYADQTSAGKSFTSPKGTLASTSGTSINNGLVTMDIDDSIFVPIITFYVKADWLGIVQPVAKPQINSVSDVSFKTGETGTVVANVQNVGNQNGNIQVWATCPSPFTVTSGTKTVSLNAGASDNVYMTVSGTSTQRISQTCTAYASVLSNQVSKSFTATVDPQLICQANQKVCDGQVLKTCNPYGSGYANQIDCAAQNKQCGLNQNGVLDCIDKNIPPRTCKIEGETAGLFDKCCEGLTNQNGICKKSGGLDINLLYIIFPALGGLLFYLTNKKDRIIWGVMGGIVGLIAAFIVDFLLKNILLTIFGVVFGGILIWLLVGGGLMTVVAIMIAARKK